MQSPKSHSCWRSLTNKAQVRLLARLTNYGSWVTRPCVTTEPHASDDHVTNNYWFTHVSSCGGLTDNQERQLQTHVEAPASSDGQQDGDRRPAVSTRSDHGRYWPSESTASLRQGQGRAGPRSPAGTKGSLGPSSSQKKCPTGQCLKRPWGQHTRGGRKSGSAVVCPRAGRNRTRLRSQWMMDAQPTGQPCPGAPGAGTGMGTGGGPG